MEAHLTQVLNCIARSMAPASLKKALSFEAVRLAQERVHLRLPRFNSVWLSLMPQMVDPLEEVMKMVSQAESSGELSSRSSTFSLGCSRSEFLSGARLSRCPRPGAGGEPRKSKITPQVRISERTETSSQERHMQRTVEQTQIMEDNFEVHKIAFLERVPEKICAQNEVIVATLSHDRNLQRTVEHAFVDFVEADKIVPQKQFSERMCEHFGVNEVLKNSSQVRNLQRTEEQTSLNKLCPERIGVRTSSQDRNLQRTVEQGCVEVDKTTPQERISKRIRFIGVP